MENLDNRVRYTKTVLQQALLKLLQTKHIDKITIKELCQEAKINRGTFYLHYRSGSSHGLPLFIYNAEERK